MIASLLALMIAATPVQPIADSAPQDGSVFPGDGFVPENGAGVHDPAICEFNGHYVCLNTGNGIGFARTSTDLIHWKVEGPLISTTPEWLQQSGPQHRSIWAPEAIRVGDGLRIYYCASAQFGHNNSWIGYAECPHFNPDHPKDGWVDRGMLIQSQDGRDNFNAIDPSVMTDANGHQWMFFGSYWSGIYVVEIDPKTGGLKGGEKKLVAKNPRDRANGIEAPSGVYHDGYYYLIVNYGLAAQGVRSTYQIMVGRSKTPDGPFTDSRGTDMVEGGHEVLLDSSPPMFGPGGGAMFRDKDGRWLMSYHYYDGRKYWGRNWGLPTLQIREILWSADGWPLPGLPISPQMSAVASRRNSSPAGKWLHQANFGDVGEIEFRKDGTIAGRDNQGGTWKQTGDRLELSWKRGEDSFLDTVQIAYNGNYYVGRNNSGLVIRGIRESAVRGR